MRTSKLKFTAVAAAAFISLLGTLSTGANAAAREHRNGGNFQAGITTNQVNRQRHVNRGGNWQNRSYNRSYSSNYYGRNHRRNNGFGIYLNLATPSTGCSYSYRKWQNTGSSYWRSRYYNCIG